MPTEDLVLGRVDHAIQRQIDEEVGDTNEIRVGCLCSTVTLRATMTALLLGIPEVHENGDTSGDHPHDEVLVRREFASVQYDVHYHHWDELARFAEDHGGVGDVGERSETKWCGSGNPDGTLEVALEEGFGIVSDGIVDGVVAVAVRQVFLVMSVSVLERLRIGFMREAEALEEGIRVLAADEDVDESGEGAESTLECAHD